MGKVVVGAGCGVIGWEQVGLEQAGMEEVNLSMCNCH